MAVEGGVGPLLDEMVTWLAHRWSGHSGSASALSRRLGDAVRWCWAHGWQPSEVDHAAGRRLATPHRQLLVALIASDAARYRAHQRADPRWLAQLDSIGAGGEGVKTDDVVRAWAERDGLDPVEAIRPGVELLALLSRLPRLEWIADPPDAWDRADRSAGATGLDPKILGKVRALLAKAESTTFSDEADALSAKAHQLMDRHAIDQAVLASSGSDPGGGGQPEARRLCIDDPYATAKAMLLSQVAGATRCDAVLTSSLALVTVFGFADDLDAVEILYTSLLVQATSAMLAAGTGGGDRSRYRSRSFRQSFLVAFSARIGERLREAAAATTAEAAADYGDALLPVLADRAEEVRAAAMPPSPTSSRAAECEPATPPAGLPVDWRPTVPPSTWARAWMRRLAGEGQTAWISCTCAKTSVEIDRDIAREAAAILGTRRCATRSMPRCARSSMPSAALS